jgi:hypothetical protein
MRNHRKYLKDLLKEEFFMNEQVKEKKTGTNYFIGGIGAVYIPVSDFWKSKKMV